MAYSLVCFGPGRKPRKQVFSWHGSYDDPVDSDGHMSYDYTLQSNLKRQCKVIPVFLTMFYLPV